MRKLLGMPPGFPPGGDMGLRPSGVGPGLWGATGPRADKPVGGAPLRPRCTACILARMSCDTLSPLPLLEMVGGFEGRGFLAALMLPRGVDDEVMLDVAAAEDAFRGAGRSAAASSGNEPSAVGLAGTGEGEGLSKTVSESTSTSGVEGLESAMAIAWAMGWRGTGKRRNATTAARGTRQYECRGGG